LNESGAERSFGLNKFKAVWNSRKIEIKKVEDGAKLLSNRLDCPYLLASGFNQFFTVDLIDQCVSLKKS